MVRTIAEVKPEEIQARLDSVHIDARKIVDGLVRDVLATTNVGSEDAELIEDLIFIGSSAEGTNYVEDSNYQPDGLGLKQRLPRYREEVREAVLRSLRTCQDFCGLIRTHIGEYEQARAA